MNNAVENASKYLEFVNESPTKYHAIDNVVKLLNEKGYNPLKIDEKWELESFGKYYIIQDDSALIAFQMNEINQDTYIKNGIRLVCAHSDSPSIKIKPNAEISGRGSLVQLNTQPYAWPILSTWFDRPLSLAGRIALKGDNAFTPTIKLVDFKSPLLLIPNAPFHLMKEDSGRIIKKQKELIPIMGSRDQGDFSIDEMIAEKSGVDKSDVLGHDLYLYPTDKAQLVGMNSDFCVAPRQDDLSMVYAATESLILSEDNTPSIKMVAFFDMEEETNSTIAGADSPFLRIVLEKLNNSIGKPENLSALISNSFAVSLDVDFAAHPNYSEVGDPTCTPEMNKGLTIKYDANMLYATTIFTAAVFQQICSLNDIPYQKTSKNSDLRGGGTISRFMQTQVEMKCVEVGISSWATHSTFETTGTYDLYNLIKALKHFYNY